MSDVLSKERILGADDLKRVFLEVPEWGGGVYVRALTGTQRDAWEDGWDSFKKRVWGNTATAQAWQAYMAIWVVVDSDGKQIFSESDVMALQAKSAKSLARIAAVAQKLNGIGSAEIAEAVKNCEGGPSDEPG